MIKLILMCSRKEYVEVKEDPAEAPHSAEDLPTRDA